ncbi:MAG TPA: PEP/pyruvate-binding domain-containing protein [Terriglobia bacterium]|nr:PEP/pyruvate-binding domain-containing protein [Terriglobia bacterium]
MRKWLQRLGLKKSDVPLSPLAVETLRTTFQARYHNFKLLLTANNKALQIMSEIEEARKGNSPFGMSFIRSHCTAICANVLRMIESMNELAPGKYLDLYGRFRSIESRISEIVRSGKTDTGTGPRTIPLASLDITKSDEAGSKLANLGEVHKRVGVRIPNGFVISSRAFREFMSHELQTEIDRLIQSSPTEGIAQLFLLSTQIQQQVIREPVPAALEEDILAAFRELEKVEGPGVKVSLRSSAIGEDSSESSFAGLYRSELNVSADNLIRAYKEVAASKYTPHAMIYRLNRGLRDDQVDMCVGCMPMVNAVAGGVIYSKNPLDKSDERIFIHSAFGLPKAVVDGSVEADLLVVTRNPSQIEQEHIAVKREKFVCYPEEGICRLDIDGEEASRPSISRTKALELANIAIRIEEHYGVAQDIEWALDEKEEIVILQCRPLRQRNVITLGGREAYRVESYEVIASGGVTASPGAGYGPVFAVMKESEVLSFPQGAVLVVRQPLPRWATVLSRAAAVIAEQGSVAGHLASVARELGVPAIMGLEGAMNLLKNGQNVTVDADGLMVCSGKIEPLLANREEPRRLMDGSPVLDVLNRASECINPLNLLDPEAPDFRPSSCRTLHDITRFCHEQAVAEVFNFGREHRFSEKASKQLVCGVPMKWWVLNLDDGFGKEVPGKLVNLEDIVSIPMLALWEGIVAVPWAGPPAIDAGGFMAILMEAAANPALDPSLPSPYTNRNYFMISKNFCSLTSRFGFHFSNVEALVSERANENYVSFSFKGGAADYDRRARRVRMVAAIVDEFGFRSKVQDDWITARAEGDDENGMKQKLRILGYLLFHTRQLDMVMSNEAAYAQWKQKLLVDISGVVLARRTENAALN